jgi:hypothetical protein
MEVKTVTFNYEKIKIARSDERTRFCCETDVQNCLYLFFFDSKCYYIGETSDSLKERCFAHTPKHITKDWFKICNKVIIIKLNDELGDIERRAIEASFILSYKSAGHPLANKK